MSLIKPRCNTHSFPQILAARIGGEEVSDGRRWEEGRKEGEEVIKRRSGGSEVMVKGVRGTRRRE